MAHLRWLHWPCLVLALLAPIGASARSQVRLQPGGARPGDAVLVTVRGAQEEPSGSLGDKELTFFPIPGGYQAILGLAVEAAAEALLLEVQVPGEEEQQDEITGVLEVSAANFAERVLKVAGKYLSPPAKVKAWIAQDKKAFAQAYAQPASPRLFSSNFEWPMASVTTAPFGDLRLFNGKKQSQHYGTDLDGRTGDPIFAANDGTVVLSRDCYASGGTVLLHHGAGIFSAYFHLSKRQVKVKDKLLKGQQLGLVGATGRVTGPHLHFGVKVHGSWVDPASVMRLDFE